ncbi:hypothetical protein ACOSZE_09325 [Lysinibacillus fusiformis]|uniref:hypothetical protein n=1 Tax=Lysinibacillus fusiformis TaxID=28031 RepID=UPI003B9FB111
MEKGEKRLIFFLSIIAGITFIAIIILTVNAYQIGVEKLEEENRVTMNSGLLSGILSLCGGIVGAFGAYFVAANQMNKQFEKQDRNRSLEIKIDKANEALNTLIELKNLTVSLYSGSIVPLKGDLIFELEHDHLPFLININQLVDEKYTKTLESNVFRILEFKQQIEQLRIFINKEIDYNNFDYCVNKFIQEYKRFINLNWEFDDDIYISNVDDFESDLFIFTVNIDHEYSEFIKVIDSDIQKIENYITGVLN